MHRIPLLLVTLSSVLAGTVARSLSNSNIVSDEERLFLKDSLDIEVLSATNTSITLQFNAGNPRNSYSAFCVSPTTPLDRCSLPADAARSVIEFGKPLLIEKVPAQETVTGLVPNTEYTCYLKVTNDQGLGRCSGPVSARTIANRFLLIADNDGPYLKSCEILNSMGALGSCTNVTLLSPEDLTVVQSSALRLIYVVDGSTTRVTKCTYDLAGTVSGCTPTSLNSGTFTLSGPATGISSTKDGLVTISLPATNGEIVQCDISPISNDLTGCVSLTGAFISPTVDSAFGVGVPFLYVVEEGPRGNIAKCSVNALGRIIPTIPCTTATTGSLPTSFPNSITYAGNFNGKNVFYITDQGSGGIVIKAEEDVTTGNLILSSGSSTAFPSVKSLAVDPSGTIAYVSQATTPGQVVACDINQATALLENCVPQPVSLVNPNGMGFIPFSA